MSTLTISEFESDGSGRVLLKQDDGTTRHLWIGPFVTKEKLRQCPPHKLERFRQQWAAALAEELGAIYEPSSTEIWAPSKTLHPTAAWLQAAPGCLLTRAELAKEWMPCNDRYRSCANARGNVEERFVITIGMANL